MTKLTHQTFSAESGDLPEKAIAYLLQYGFTQSMQDAVAGSAKAVKDLAAACRAGGDGFDKAHAKWLKWAKDCNMIEDLDFANNEHVELFAKRAVTKDAEERFMAILAGTVGTRGGGPRLDPVERVMREIAEAAIKAQCKSKGIKLPSDAEMKEYVRLFLEANEADTRKRAQKRLKEEAELGKGVVLDFLPKA